MNLYKEKTKFYAKYCVAGSDDFLEGVMVITIKDLGKQPISANLKVDSSMVSFAPKPPEKKEIKAKDLMELFLKVTRFFKKYGYELK